MIEKEKEKTVVLFDFDGVIVDTESQYSVFWDKIGRDYLGIDGMDAHIKGQTLDYIYTRFFPNMEKEQAEITAALDEFERTMDYSYIPGVLNFISDLKAHGVPMAVVTSSNDKKMAAVYQAHPELRTLFDRILTADMFAASKPAPDCFLLGMEVLGGTPETTYVFEDSFNGLKAGMASKATVIGLATTNPREAIAPLCHHVLDDFCGFTYQRMTELNIYNK